MEEYKYRISIVQCRKALGKKFEACTNKKNNRYPEIRYIKIIKEKEVLFKNPELLNSGESR